MDRKKLVRYAWRVGAVTGGVDAQVAGEELQRISDKSGGLAASAVVQESRPEAAPLHPAFEWDDAVAGERWRTHQARNLIRAVQVLPPASKPREKPAPVFVHVPAAGPLVEGRYVPVAEVVRSPASYYSALSALVRRVHEAETAAQALRDAADGAQDEQFLVRVDVAIQALRTAGDAVRALQ